MRQTTIKTPIFCSGTGLHSGKEVHCTLWPAPANTGIVFALHTPQGVRTVSPSPYAVMATTLATTLGHDNAKVSTVEHLLAAIRGLGLDNLRIEVQGQEIPVLDGSAKEFVEMIRKSGLKRLSDARQVLRITRPLELTEGNKYIRAYPYAGFKVDYRIDFPHPVIGKQQYSLDLTPMSFDDVAEARTFGFLKDIEYLRKNGLALGGTLDNAVVIDDNGVVNKEGLRFSDEFVRHKILDFIGDMAMLALPLEGRFEVNCSGHQLNNAFLRMADQEHALQRITYAETVQHQPRLHSPELVLA